MKHKFEDIIINVTQKKKPTDDDRNNYIGLEHLESGNLFIEKYGSERTPDGEKIVMKKGDVLFGKRRAYQKKVAISPCDGIFSAHGMVLRPKENVICKDYLPFFISSDKFLDEAIRISVGGLSPTINWKDIKELEFDLPPLDKQEQLAKKLWAAYEVKQSYLKMITATDEILISRFLEMFDKVKNKKSLCDICRPKQWPTIPASEFTDEGYLVYGANGIIGKYNRYNHEDKTITIACRGASCGAVNITEPKSYITGNAMAIDNIIENVQFEYLAYFLHMFDFKRIITGGAQPQITFTNLKKVEVPIPSMELQSEFEKTIKQADKSKLELRQSVAAIEKVIKSLINENL